MEPNVEGSYSELTHLIGHKTSGPNNGCQFIPPIESFSTDFSRIFFLSAPDAKTLDQMSNLEPAILRTYTGIAPSW